MIKVAKLAMDQIKIIVYHVTPQVQTEMINQQTQISPALVSVNLI